jgi:hypothetical protein
MQQKIINNKECNRKYKISSDLALALAPSVYIVKKKILPVISRLRTPSRTG